MTDNLNYSNERIAEAYELLGSTFLDEHFDLRLTITYWRRALQIRSDNNNVLVKQCNLAPNEAYTNAKEFTTIEELNLVANDLDAMRMQSLLISERILGPMHKEMIYRLMYRGILSRSSSHVNFAVISGAAYADGLQYQRCVSWLAFVKPFGMIYFFLLFKPDRSLEICIYSSYSQR